MKFNANYWLASLFFSLILAGCSSNKPLTSSDPGPEQATAVAEDIRTLLESAQNSTSPLKEHYYLRAAEQLQASDRSDWAENLLKAIDPTLLEAEELARYTEVFSAIAMEQKAWFLAERILTNPRLEQQWATLPAPTRLTLGQRRAELFALLGDATASIRERIRLADTLPAYSQPSVPFSEAPETESQVIHTDRLDSDANQDAIWETLMTLPQADLQALSLSETDRMLSGWYKLAVLSKNNQSDLARQLAQVDLWINQWPEHPASLRLPSDLKLLRQLIQDLPDQIALLLPMQGKLAKSGAAIRDGFLAAYYRALDQGSSVPAIRVYDSAATGDINVLYQQALSDGADLIIGPLDKGQVAELNLNLELPIPTLALNYNDTPAQPADGLFQFGLAIEDEARQAAQRAFTEGHRLAMALTPNTNRGRRAAAAFTQEWETLGGTLVQNSHYRGAGDFSDVILKALKVDESRRRARGIRSLFGSLEFEPRRRQDIDMIFLDANPGDARQIKPTLAFHYASTLPVYATRNIYAGRLDRKADRDLNGIRFSTLPWMFDQQSPEKQSIVKYAKASSAYHSLYALGLDAYRIYPRLRQLAEVPRSRIYGSTGTLSLQNNNRILREQSWASIKNGRAIQLSAVTKRSGQ